ncbi:hypothetical protein ACKKBF_B31365 [Auxenochlorella protothecoides x Auxenochlorella symbiontica]
MTPGEDKAETLTHACEDRPRRSPDRSDGGGVAILPLKRARSDEALPAPQETPSKKRNGPDQALLHDKFQRKLVSGQAATRGERAAEAKQSVTVTGTPPPGAKLTPLEQQVTDLKRQHPGVLLVVECGYKFRFFGEDAETASRILNVFSFPDHNYLVASIPAHRLHVHVRRLVEAGCKVGIVRQTETAAIKAAGTTRSAPFQRRMTELYTRATLEAGELGESACERPGDAPGQPGGSARFLVCVVEAEGAQGRSGGLEVGMVAVETATGAVLFSQFRDSVLRSELEARLLFVPPSEVLVPSDTSAPTRRLLACLDGGEGPAARVEEVDAGRYAAPGAAGRAVAEFYGEDRGGAGPGEDLDGGADEAHGNEVRESEALDDQSQGNEAQGRAAGALPPLALRALAHALDHLRPFHLEGVLRWGAGFQQLNTQAELALSPNTLRQLDVLVNSSTGQEKGSLLWLLNHTRTAFGARRLRHWVSHPLRSAAAITARLDAVQQLREDDCTHAPLAALPGLLRSLPDLEKGLTRALHGTTAPSECVAVLGALRSLRAALARPAGAQTLCPLLASLLARAGSEAVQAAALEALGPVDEAAAAADDRLGLFRPGRGFAGVDARREGLAAARQALHDQLPAVRAVLGLRALDYVAITNQSDYLIDVPVELVGRVPKDWERVSSVKKSVRYHPPGVKAAIKALELAQEHLAAACQEAWRDWLRAISVNLPLFRSAADALAELDCLLGLATLAGNSGYVRPDILPASPEGGRLAITACRHPMLDVQLGPDFVPNDVALGSGPGGEPRALVLTGPNMGGKSCYIRSAALVAIMAQLGSFVPAQAASLAPFDAVFTRMGASDNLALGRSTFLEELGEASAILSQATPASLVILDELGRGTSTEDGVALARATLEHLATRTRCLTMFVTHYPEVPAAAAREEGLRVAVRLGRMAVLERGGTPPSVAFLHRLEPGAATASFGLNVARMAALPPAVLAAAGARAAHAGGLGTVLKDLLAASERDKEDLGALQQHVRAVLALC